MMSRPGSTLNGESAAPLTRLAPKPPRSSGSPAPKRINPSFACRIARAPRAGPGGGGGGAAGRGPRALPPRSRPERRRRPRTAPASTAPHGEVEEDEGLRASGDRLHEEEMLQDLLARLGRGGGLRGRRRPLGVLPPHA